jgi:glycosyltransferase involved in cell wall biosynthesis
MNAPSLETFETHSLSVPCVSVLLPIWNAAATLNPALASLQRQRLHDWECIAVDDGSDDGTASIVRRFSDADARIRLVQTPHRGLVSALNEGLTHCRAPFIARMDADDVMHRARLARQVDALAADAALAAVGCHVRIFPRTAMSPGLRHYEQWLNAMHSATDVERDAFIECPIAHPSLMMRREVAPLGYRDVGWPEDYDLILRALSKGFRIGVVAERLLSWRDRRESLCRTSDVYGVDRFTACKAHFLAGGFLARDEHYILWGYGATGRSLRRALAVHGKRPSYIVEVKTSRIGQRIHGAPVIPISGLQELRDTPIVVSVARADPRQEIRNALAELRFVEGRDFVCAA